MIGVRACFAIDIPIPHENASMEGWQVNAALNVTKPFGMGITRYSISQYSNEVHRDA